MKVAAVVIRDAEGERRYKLDRLPLRLGTGSDCDIRLPGPGNAAVAIIDDLDGEPFVQPLGKPAVRINVETLRTSRKLVAGDELEFFGSRVRIDELADAMLATVHLEHSAYITTPPEVAEGAGVAQEAIAPTAFCRATDTAAEAPESTAWRWQVGVGLALMLLLTVSWLLFSSRSVQFQVAPGEPDHLAISGGWFRLPVGNRTLLRPGNYTVTVRKEGYFEVNRSFEVGDERSKTVSIELRKLPGKLTVRTDPEVEALVTVNDTLIGRAPHGPLVLEPGLHTVSVSADRFLPYSGRVAVAGLDRDEQLYVQLVPRWAEVEITSVPAGATIYRGQEEVGKTPARLQLMEGSHELSVVLDGYKAWDGTVTAVPAEDKVLPVIELEPANAQLQVHSVPLGASVTVNGRYRGQSPVKLALSPDVDYDIGLSKAGYGSTVRQVRLPAAVSRSLTVDLTARVGVVTVRVQPEDAEILVDGTLKGRGTADLDLPSAPHQLEVRKEGYETYRRTITPRPGYPQAIDVRLLSDEEVRRRSVAANIETSQGQSLRRVEPGEFTMGSSRRQQGRRANEVLVPVRITRPFYLGEKEITNREFRRFRPNHNSGGELHPSLAGDNNPVANVSWSDAAEYCNWLSAQEGLTPAYEKRFEKWEPVKGETNGYRLPTEAEWALAIRYGGGQTAPVFPWGDRMPPRRDSGNYADQSAEGVVPTILPGYTDGFTSTAPVGSFPPNALGLYDGGGNVAEWVQDYYSVPTPGQTDPVIDPTGPASGRHHVIRGSSWRHAGVMELRLAYRDFGSEGRPDVGFRIARSADTSDSS